MEPTKLPSPEVVDGLTTRFRTVCHATRSTQMARLYPRASSHTDDAHMQEWQNSWGGMATHDHGVVIIASPLLRCVTASPLSAAAPPLSAAAPPLCLRFRSRCRSSIVATGRRRGVPTAPVGYRGSSRGGGGRCAPPRGEPVSRAPHPVPVVTPQAAGPVIVEPADVTGYLRLAWRRRRSTAAACPDTDGDAGQRE